MKTGKPILIMAGGTGGHVFPALAVAEQLRARGVPVVWLGTRRGLEAKLVPDTGIVMEWIGVSGLRGNGVKRWLSAPFMLTKALLQATLILLRLKPCLALGMGGFVSGPGGLMARCLGIPLVIHEQNAVVGLTNRWLSRLANRVLQGFPHSFPMSRHAITVGNPVRSSIAALAPPARRFREQGRTRVRLLVLGGSQGALVLNQLVPLALARLAPAERPLVWHQAGGKLYELTVAAYREAGVEAVLESFIDDMARAYGWADLVVCRAGALTVAELAAAGVGALLVPFPFAVDDHQSANAVFLQRHGAAVINSQAALGVESLADGLRTLLADRDRLLGMAEAARQLARTDAAQKVAAICMEQINPEPARQVKIDGCQ